MRNLFKRVKKLITNEYFLLAVILIGAFGVRLYKIDNPVADWHSWRQADTASVTRIYVQDGIDLLMPRYHDISSIQTGIFNPRGLRFVEFPLYNAVHALLAGSFTFLSLEVWGRLLSVFSALVSTYVLYLIGKRFMGKWGGLLSAFFFAIIPFNIYFTRVILPETMAVTFGLLGMYAFIRFIDSEVNWQLYISGVLLAISMLIKPFSFFFIVPLAYMAIRKYGFKKMITTSKIFIPFLIFFNLMIVPFFAWRIWINQYPVGIPHFKWAFNGDGIRFKPAFWRWIFAERIGDLALGVWGLIPFGFALLTKIKDKFSYFNHFFLLGMFLYVATFATASVRHDYYQTFVIPALSLAMAQGSLEMWRTKNFNKILSRSLLVFSIMVMLITGGMQIKELYKINHPEIIRAGQALDEVAPEDALVLAPYNGDTALLYQTRRRGWPVVETSVEEHIEQGADYYVSVNFGDPDTIRLIEQYEVIERTGEYVIVNLHERK